MGLFHGCNYIGSAVVEEREGRASGKATAQPPMKLRGLSPLRASSLG